MTRDRRAAMEGRPGSADARSSMNAGTAKRADCGGAWRGVRDGESRSAMRRAHMDRARRAAAVRCAATTMGRTTAA